MYKTATRASACETLKKVTLTRSNFSFGRDIKDRFSCKGTALGVTYSLSDVAKENSRGPIPRDPVSGKGAAV